MAVELWFSIYMKMRATFNDKPVKRQ